MNPSAFLLALVALLVLLTTSQVAQVVEMARPILDAI